MYNNQRGVTTQTTKHQNANCKAVLHINVDSQKYNEDPIYSKKINQVLINSLKR